VHAGNGAPAPDRPRVFLITAGRTTGADPRLHDRDGPNLTSIRRAARPDGSSTGGPVPRGRHNRQRQGCSGSGTSQDHVPIFASERAGRCPARRHSTPWDWFLHVNRRAPRQLTANVLIDARDTGTTYKVSRHNGQHNLGGGSAARPATFSFRAAARARCSNRRRRDLSPWQHDPEALGDDEYTVFDNESGRGRRTTGAGSTLPSSASVVPCDSSSTSATATATLLQSREPAGRA